MDLIRRETTMCAAGGDGTPCRIDTITGLPGNRLAPNVVNRSKE